MSHGVFLELYLNYSSKSFGIAIVEKHRETFQAHPVMFADLIYNHAITSYKMGQSKAGLKNLGRAIEVSTQHTFGRMFYRVINSIKRRGA